MNLDLNTLPFLLGQASGDCEALWISTDEFQKLAQLHKSNASEALRTCYEGRTWRKHSLLVRTPNGGPASAANPYQVRVETLPPDLYFKWLEKRCVVAAH